MLRADSCAAIETALRRCLREPRHLASAATLDLSLRRRPPDEGVRGPRSKIHSSYAQALSTSEAARRDASACLASSSFGNAIRFKTFPTSK